MTNQDESRRLIIGNEGDPDDDSSLTNSQRVEDQEGYQNNLDINVDEEKSSLLSIDHDHPSRMTMGNRETTSSVYWN